MDIQQIIMDLCKWKGIAIVEGHMMPDHVHLLLSIPPKHSISEIMGYLKGKSAMMIFNKHGYVQILIADEPQSVQRPVAKVLSLLG